MKKTHHLLLDESGMLIQPSLAIPAIANVRRTATSKNIQRFVLYGVPLLMLAAIYLIPKMPIHMATLFYGLVPLTGVVVVLQLIRIGFEYAQFRADNTPMKQQMELCKVFTGLVMFLATFTLFVNSIRIWIFKPIHSASCHITIIFGNPLKVDDLQLATGYWLCPVFSKNSGNKSLGYFKINTRHINTLSSMRVGGLETQTKYSGSDVYSLELHCSAEHWMHENKLRTISENDLFNGEYFIEFFCPVPEGTKYRYVLHMSVNDKPPLSIYDKSWRSARSGFLIPLNRDFPVPK